MNLILSLGLYISVATGATVANVFDLTNNNANNALNALANNNNHPFKSLAASNPAFNFLDARNAALKSLANSNKAFVSFGFNNLGINSLTRTNANGPINRLVIRSGSPVSKPANVSAIGSKSPVSGPGNGSGSPTIEFGDKVLRSGHGNATTIINRKLSLPGSHSPPIGSTRILPIGSTSGSAIISDGEPIIGSDGGQINDSDGGSAVRYSHVLSGVLDLAYGKNSN